ncbi:MULTISPECIES: helix-turn-helix domain-containing protein [unclassified Exiguobacterium]|uniref:helix-turn-helix domain-containing protein n=1 Tax=unclassified Exiguobacterium TaxID=2644629 RepID=UPI000E9E786F|nr:MULTISPECIES: helix-turn-helix domain-containing protein [unclassified Exiguobacterium]HAL01143.1 DNA-binding protein [Exiguobacterium sp.]HBF59112.1 DNA-binding protein [Exiguobacterium sp.]HCV53391.1 DNA-binding protein [Exiguobacterium sp.]
MLTTKQISELLRVSEETVRRWIRTGELHAEQDGKGYLVDELALKRLVDQKSQIPGTAMNKILPLIQDMFGPEAAQFAKSNLFDPLRQSMEQAPSKPEASTESLAEELDRLKRKKRRLELEHELKLLEIEEKIAAIERKVQS